MSASLKVCIDARHVAGRSGGTATFTLSLARALSNLTDGDERYSFLVRPGDGPYLEQQVQKTLQIMESAATRRSLARRVAVRIPFGRRIAERFGRTLGTEVPQSDRTVERNEIDVIHFTAQGGFLTDIPFIYHPHDLQHRHLPQLLTPRKCAVRDYWYSTLCKNASTVCVVSQWGKQDLLKSFDLPESKVQMVHYAPDPSMCIQSDPETVTAIGQKLSLPERFIFYPARTWPHKNHLRLFQALKHLRDLHGLIIPLVCSGEPTEFFPSLKAEARSLGLDHQVSFLGFVDFNQLSAIYALCSAVVIPTLFEAGSFPLWEAFLSGIPTACSNVTSLPAQAGDSSVIFNPYRVEDIAEAVRKLWTDSDLCATLVERGRTNISRFSWDTTARTFRAKYRQLGKRHLTLEDERLLSSPPLM